MVLYNLLTTRCQETVSTAFSAVCGRTSTDAAPCSPPCLRRSSRTSFRNLHSFADDDYRKVTRVF